MNAPVPRRSVGPREPTFPEVLACPAPRLGDKPFLHRGPDVRVAYEDDSAAGLPRVFLQFVSPSFWRRS